MRPEAGSAGTLSGGRSLRRPALPAGTCVVVAEFDVPPSALEEFIAVAGRFAQDCLDHEPGCLQFDVVRLDSTPHAVLVEETYVDAEAFEAHCASAHLMRFKAGGPPLIRGERPLRRGVA